MSNSSGEPFLLEDEPLKADPDLGELIRRSEILLEDVRQIGEQCDQIVLTRYRNLLGSYLDELLCNLEATILGCTHLDPTRRRVAIAIAIDHWNYRGATARHFYEELLRDSDLGVASAAARALGLCFDSTQDRRMGCILAAIAADVVNDGELALSAYRALVRLHGDTGQELSVLAIKSRIDFDSALLSKYKYW